LRKSFFFPNILSPLPDQTRFAMAQRKLNCWEYKKCGREPGGIKATSLGVCPAAADNSFDGINRGENAGRFCWAVAGTFCGGSAQGTFAEKRESCLSCDFFNKVRTEEGSANLQTKFLKFISRDTDSPLLKDMTYQHVPSGERFITQGDSGDVAYIIQRGSCMVIVEKNGQLHPVGHRGEGDIVGAMSLFTGEPRSAHVEADTDMELWVLKKDDFDNISTEEPDLLFFLTELIADRFDSRRPIADRTIGKYLATDIIGRGGFSLVYRGQHLGLSMPVAIKMMRHDMAADPDFLGNFRNEAKTIANLNHENIVQVHDIEERYRTVFIIMEFVQGESLTDMLERLKTIPSRLAADYLYQICSGLDYAHQQGIIHRDINTKNIMVQQDDRLKILDFGLACPMGTEDFSSLGTLMYMAPEQINSHPLDQRTDIYALGITAYAMVVGKRPFPEDDVKALTKMHQTRDIPDPAAKKPELPEALRQFILKAGKCDPDQRYQNIVEAREAIQPLIHGPLSDGKMAIAEARKETTILMSYEDDRQSEFRQLMEEFSARARQLGGEFKVTDN
jgi:CRP-like cAMP-binding protein/tRNA A-37 threonylcarbamoyl transferase component Bud32